MKVLQESCGNNQKVGGIYQFWSPQLSAFIILKKDIMYCLRIKLNMLAPIFMIIIYCVVIPYYYFHLSTPFYYTDSIFFYIIVRLFSLNHIRWNNKFGPIKGIKLTSLKKKAQLERYLLFFMKKNSFQVFQWRFKLH